MKTTTTPMMQQYESARSRLCNNTFLLFRLGDFYELFNEDAKQGAKILGITLTQRHGAPMAGIPYHAADNYISKLLSAGKKVAICEQLDAPAPGKLVRRSITRILTPGTLLEDQQLESKHSNMLLAIHEHKNQFSVSFLDLTTATFQIASCSTFNLLLPLLYSLDPKEILLPEKFIEKHSQSPESTSWIKHLHGLCQNRVISELPKSSFDVTSAVKSLRETLNVLTLEGFGITHTHPGLGPAGALLEYVTQNLCQKPENLRSIQEYIPQKTLLLDPSSLRNLEVFKTTANTRKGSLLDAMDATVTPAGARLLEAYLMAPSQDIEEITRRQTLVGVFITQPRHIQKLQDLLSNTRDLVRIIGRLQNRLRNPRELSGIRDTLEKIPFIADCLLEMSDPYLKTLQSNIHTFDSLFNLLKEALADNLPNDLKEGGYIRDAYKAELDELRMMSQNHKQWLANLESKEQEATGIKNLKIKYNGAYGYFIEVSKSNLHLVPNHYIRKQTITTGERFFTEDLKQKEQEIVYAEQKSIALEEKIFKELVEMVLKESEKLIQTAHALASLDLFLGWAYLARKWNYTCPVMEDSDTLEIVDGRHPVVEQAMKADNVNGKERFVPNSTYLSSRKDQIMLITGPNMAGKSTYIRQVALITLMAHVGAWVPAKSCKLGLVDRIFSRIGASDDLANGNSTFMVEMHETANILNNTTDKSLIILDEVGRGTSTYDGLSIAWSVVEYLHGTRSKGPKTLFATHYHELTNLENALPRLNNFLVEIQEVDNTILFTHKLKKGAADRSYGLHVAQLAGLPQSVIERAKSILNSLENGAPHLAKPASKTTIVDEPSSKEGQLAFF